MSQASIELVIVLASRDPIKPGNQSDRNGNQYKEGQNLALSVFIIIDITPLTNAPRTCWRGPKIGVIAA
jgi:hypothetical protein